MVVLIFLQVSDVTSQLVCTSGQSFTLVDRNRRVFEVTSGKTRTYCSLECVSKTACIGFFYDKDTETCHLLDNYEGTISRPIRIKGMRD